MCKKQAEQYKELESIIERKVKESLGKKQKEEIRREARREAHKELKTEIKNRVNSDTGSEQKIYRRDFLKKAGLGAAGIGATLSEIFHN